MKSKSIIYCFLLVGMSIPLKAQVQLPDTTFPESPAWQGIVHARNDRLDSALSHLSRAAQQIDEVQHLALREKTYRHLIDIYQDKQQADSALKYANLLVDLQDSILVSEPEQQLNHQLLKYTLSKKEDEIRILQKEEELERVQLRHQRQISAAIGVGLALVLGFLWTTFRQKSRIAREKERSDELLLNILPAEVAEELKANGKSEARDFEEATLLFTDFKEFTQAAESMSPSELVNEIHSCFKAFDGICEEYKIEKIKTIGDAYMAAGGLPATDKEAVKNVVRAALDMADFMKARNEEKRSLGERSFEMRIGIHTGPVVAGIVGVKKFQYDVWGDTVNTAARMESAGETGRVNISAATYQYIRNEEAFHFIPRGEVFAKGKGLLEMYFVEKAT